MKKYNVAVLMSTFNGEKYIREQIDSLLGQKSVDINIYIRDDGSSDDTLKILEEYKKNILIQPAKKTNKKPQTTNLKHTKPQKNIRNRCKKN